MHRDFYYIDTGYFGNGRKKTYHRITKNDMQNLGEIKHRPRDRLSATGFASRKFRPGANILLAPPSQKLLNLYDIDLETWLDQTMGTIQQHTDRPIVVRERNRSRTDRKINRVEKALDDVHAVVTFNSTAATEAILAGVPVFALAPSNAARPVSNTDLSQIDQPWFPDQDQVLEWAYHLAYGQFHIDEIKNGTAARILFEHD